MRRTFLSLAVCVILAVGNRFGYASEYCTALGVADQLAGAGLANFLPICEAQVRSGQIAAKAGINSHCRLLWERINNQLLSPRYKPQTAKEYREFCVRGPVPPGQIDCQSLYDRFNALGGANAGAMTEDLGAELESYCTAWKAEKDEEEQAESEQRQRTYLQYVDSYLGCVTTYQVTACDQALRYANRSTDDDLHLQRARVAALTFRASFQNCQNGSIGACDDAAQSPAASPNDITRIRERRSALTPIGFSFNIPNISGDVWPIVAAFLGTRVPNATAWAVLLFGIVAAGKAIVRLKVLPIEKVQFVVLLIWIEWAAGMIAGTSLDKPRVGDLVVITGFLLLVASALQRPGLTTLEDRSGEWTTG